MFLHLLLALTSLNGFSITATAEYTVKWQIYGHLINWLHQTRSGSSLLTSLLDFGLPWSQSHQLLFAWSTPETAGQCRGRKRGVLHAFSDPIVQFTQITNYKFLEAQSWRSTNQDKGSWLMTVPGSRARKFPPCCFTGVRSQKVKDCCLQGGPSSPEWSLGNFTAPLRTGL